MSICENTVAPFNSVIMSSTVGIMLCVRGMALFATRIFTVRRILFYFLGVMTVADTHPVGFSTFSIISSSSSNLSNSFSSGGLTLKGILRCGWATGSTLWSTCKSTSAPSILPMPQTISGYLCIIFSLINPLC